MGIIIMFYSNEHEPIHIHAIYNGSKIRVSFYFRDGKIYRTTYTPENGTFAANKLKQLKQLVSVHKYSIAAMWADYFIYKKAPVFKKINIQL